MESRMIGDTSGWLRGIVAGMTRVWTNGVTAPQINVGVVADFWRVVREVNLGGVIHEGRLPFSIAICGAPDSGKTTLRTALTGGRWVQFEDSPYLTVVEDDSPPEADLYLYVVDALRGITTADLQNAISLARRKTPLICVVNKIDLARYPESVRHSAEQLLGPPISAGLAFTDATDVEQVQRELVPLILRALPNLRLALGRWLPPFRDRAAIEVIQQTSRVNAEFALLSSLPASIPILSVGVAGADMVVLTKNQVMMLFRLATLYGRPLQSQGQLIVELMPVIGAAFLWRSVARTLVGLLPAPVAMAPKALVAFVGTYIIGRSAQHYYRLGKRPSARAVERYGREAGLLAKRAVPRLQLPPSRGLPRLRLPSARRLPLPLLGRNGRVAADSTRIDPQLDSEG